MTTDKIAVDAYKYFSSLEGNQHIASEFALKMILKIIAKHKPKAVLELGLGIGSISYSILSFSKMNNQEIVYYGTERNEFCLDALSKYLKEYYTKVKLYSSLSEVPTDIKFDLVIIDGSDENIKKVENCITKNGMIIIEGDRIPQLNILKTIFPKSFYTRVISNYKNPNYGPFSSENYSGGLQLIFINPNLKQKIDFWKYKIYTSLNYKKRALKK